MPLVTVRYFAAARAASGVDSEALPLPDASTVDDVLAVMAARHGEPLRRVLSASSLLLDAVTVHDRSTHPPDGAVLDVLPPFAGG